jgi:hypothetical protein
VWRLAEPDLLSASPWPADESASCDELVILDVTRTNRTLRDVGDLKGKSRWVN